MLYPACRAALVLAAMAVAASAVVAQTESDTRKEWWPETQILVRTSPKTRLFFDVNRSQERESRADAEIQLGVHADYIPTESVWFRVGYRYGRSLGSEGTFREHRILTEQTFKATLPGRIVVSDRNRQDFRFVRGDYSFRYRNRLTVEREVALRSYRFSPYLQGEVYFDSRYRTWNRTRYGAGIVLPLAKPHDPGATTKSKLRDHLSLDIYYMHQHDTRSSPTKTNALGACLVISF